MINELFQIVSYSYEPRRPLSRHKNETAAPSAEQAPPADGVRPHAAESFDKEALRPEEIFKNVIPISNERNETNQPDTETDKKPGRSDVFNEQEGKNSSAHIRQALTEQEKKNLEELKKTDLEVRQHEQAHIAAAGPYATGVSYTYRTGPDGNRYAVGGHVDIDTSEVPDDPEATIEKARTVRRAANAPSNPSAQDLQVSAEATRMETKARLEKIQNTLEADEESAGLKKELAISAYTGNFPHKGSRINISV